VNEQRRPERAKDRDCLGRPAIGVRGDADVERLALLHGGVQGAERFLERCVGVEAMVIEDVDVVDAEAAQALIQAGQQVLARSEVAVRPRPHVPSRLGRDHKLIAVRSEVGAQNATEIRLRTAVWGAVVVRQVEMGDAEVERAPQDGALAVDGAAVAEVLPEPQRHRGERETAAPTAAVGHRGIPVGCGDEGREVGHASIVADGLEGVHVSLSI